MLTPEQRRERAKGVGASDIPILLGISPYSLTVHDVYLQKIDPEHAPDEEPTLAQEVGNVLEPLALRWLGKARDREVVPNRLVYVHPSVPWARCTPDGFLVQDLDTLIREPVEAKAPGYWMQSGWGASDDAVPDFVYAQCHWQMFVLGAQRAHATAIFGNEHRHYEIKRDENVIRALFATAKKFWEDNVLPRRPPAVDGSKGASRMVDALFPKAEPGSLIVLDESHPLTHLGRRAIEVRDAAKAAATELEMVKQELKVALGNIELARPDADAVLEGPGVQIRWANTKAGRRLTFGVPGKKKHGSAEADE